jgi:hypothetical protein
MKRSGGSGFHYPAPATERSRSRPVKFGPWRSRRGIPAGDGGSAQKATPDPADEHEVEPPATLALDTGVARCNSAPSP